MHYYYDCDVAFSEMKMNAGDEVDCQMLKGYGSVFYCDVTVFVLICDLLFYAPEKSYVIRFPPNSFPYRLPVYHDRQQVRVPH